MSRDTNTLPWQGKASGYDEEGVAVPRSIIAWIFQQEDLADNLKAAEAGTAPDIIYSRGVPACNALDTESFDHKDFSLILFEISFCKDLGYQEKLTTKTKKYHPLCALRRQRGRFELL